MASTITSDNGIVTKSHGLKASADSSGVLAFNVGTGTTALTLSATATNQAVFAGTVSAPGIVATNGFMAASTAINTSYVVGTGTNAFSIGPVAVATGTTVTVATGQRWVIL
jgi:hypothetical protein